MNHSYRISAETKRLLWLGLVAGAALSALPSRALTLSEYLDKVRQKNGLFESTTLSKQAAEARREQGDLVLSPYLTAQTAYFDDQSEPSLPGFQGNRTTARSFSLGVAKKLATGTGVSLNYEVKKSETFGLPAKVTEPWTSGLTFGFSQSLWRDAFGAGTRARRERESSTAVLEKLGQETQARQLLVTAEAAYWDAIYQKEEVKVRQESLQRSERLVDWTRRRLGNGIGDSSDLLQAQALTSTRRIQLLTAQDESLAATRKLADYVQVDNPAELESAHDDYTLVRDLKSFAGSDQPARIDAVMQSYEARVKKGAADEVHDALRPDLQLAGSVTANSREAGASDALSNSFETGKPTASVGLKFVMDLDRPAVDKVRAGLRADARGAELKAAQAQYESESAWKELTRRHQVLSERIRIMEDLVRTNQSKVKRENERLNIGRTTTFQVISFEQDQADAQVLLLKLKTEQRKLESQAKLFVPKDISEAL
ncbi:MAG: TolC family protein [Bdellovibrionales bacterium]|nr:TolC family protein [Bdellovibrionales bacterium]